MKRGRPPICKIERLRIESWFWDVIQLLGLNSSYALEKIYKRISFYEVPENLFEELPEFVCSNQFLDYKKAVIHPGADVIEWGARRYGLHGTQKRYEHILWDILKNPNMGLDEAHAFMQHLPYNIAQHLLTPAIRNSDFSHKRHYNLLRKSGYHNAIRECERISNLDSLAASLILICEARHFQTKEHSHQLTDAIIASFRIFCRLSSYPHFFYTATDIYEVLKGDFYRHPMQGEIIANLEAVEINEIKIRNLMVVQFLDCLDVLGGEKPLPACLCLAEKYLVAYSTTEIVDLIYLDDLKYFRSIPEITKLLRSIKRWKQANKPDVRPINEVVNQEHLAA